MQTSLFETSEFATKTFSCLEELESLLEEGEESYKQGKYKPWSEAFADIKSRYSL